MENLMTIYDVLAAPAGAQLVSNHGELALVVIDRPHDRKVSVELFPLGNAVTAAEVLKLFDVLGLLPGPTPMSTPIHTSAPTVAASTAQAPATGVRCEQCGRTFKNAHALEVHVGRKHGGEAAPAVAAVSDTETSIDPGARDTDVLPDTAFAVSPIDETPPARSDLDLQIEYTKTNIEAAARLGATDADLDPARRELLRLCRLRAARHHANGRQPVEAV